MKSDSTIISFIQSFPVSASFKEADTGRYIANNLHNSRQFGIEDPAELIGLTINDVRFCQPKWGAQYAAIIERLDFRARESKSHVIGRHQFIDDSGEVQIEEMIKFPVLGSKKNILGIVTYRNDITSTLAPYQLYRLYRDFYDAKNAIAKLMASIEVAQFFLVPPTDAQIRTFLLKIERFSNKEIAKSLDISVRTVECHLDALRNKVADGNLNGILGSVKWSVKCAGD